MRLAGPAIADEQNWFGSLDVAALSEVAHLRRGDQWRLGVVEFVERFHSRQVCFFDPPLDRISLPFFDLGGQQNLQITGVCFLLTHRLLGQSAEL